MKSKLADLFITDHVDLCPSEQGSSNFVVAIYPSGFCYMSSFASYIMRDCLTGFSRQFLVNPSPLCVRILIPDHSSGLSSQINILVRVHVSEPYNRTGFMITLYKLILSFLEIFGTLTLWKERTKLRLLYARPFLIIDCFFEVIEYFYCLERLLARIQCSRYWIN